MSATEHIAEEAELAARLKGLANDPEANDISDLAPAQGKVIARGDGERIVTLGPG